VKRAIRPVRVDDSLPPRYSEAPPCPPTYTYSIGHVKQEGPRFPFRGLFYPVAYPLVFEDALYLFSIPRRFEGFSLKGNPFTMVVFQASPLFFEVSHLFSLSCKLRQVPPSDLEIF